MHLIDANGHEIGCEEFILDMSFGTAEIIGTDVVVATYIKPSFAEHYLPGLMTFNSDGDTLWSRIYDIFEGNIDAAFPCRIRVLGDSIIYMSVSEGLGLYSYKCGVLKTDGRGEILWDTIYSFDEPSNFCDLIINECNSFSILVNGETAKLFYRINSYGAKVCSTFYHEPIDSNITLSFSYADENIFKSVSHSTITGFTSLSASYFDSCGVIAENIFYMHEVGNRSYLDLFRHDDHFWLIAVLSDGMDETRIKLLKISLLGDSIYGAVVNLDTLRPRNINFVPCQNGDFFISGYYFNGDSTFGFALRVDSLGNSVSSIIERIDSRRFSIDIFPNPFNSSCVISISDVGAIHELPLQNAQIEIFDLRGNIIYRGLINQTPVPNTFIWRPDESIPGGVYFVKATIYEQGTSVLCTQTTTKRFVLMR